MRIVFHPGPNKTGTTSIQSYLRRAVGSEEPQKVWYPTAKTKGNNPGHSFLILALRKNQDRALDIISGLVEQAASSGVETLIFSTEDFCKVDQDVLQAVAERFRPHRLEVVVTLTNVRAQCVSWWQEQIKHGQTNEYGSKVALRRVDESPVTRDTIISDFIAGFSPDRISVVIMDKRASEDQLINDFMRAVGIEAEAPAELRKPAINRSHGLVELEIIRHLNIIKKEVGAAHPEVDMDRVRKKVVNMMMQPAWKNVIQRVPLSFPESWAEITDQKSERLFADVCRLRDEGRLEVFGDPEVIRARDY